MKEYRIAIPVITGVIHTVYALLLGKEDVAEMIRDGLINSTGDNYSRAFTLWFLVCGIILILWGQTLQYYIKKSRNLHPCFWDIVFYFCCGRMYCRADCWFLFFCHKH